jgi:penicillin amidase
MRQLLRWVPTLLVFPGRPRPDGCKLRWLAWGALALTGVSARTRTDGGRRSWPGWLARSVQGVGVRLLLALVAAALVTVGLLRGSLPKLDGTCAVPGLSAPVRIERDGQGIPTIHAANRADLACGLGFVHAQDRFFQMDLLRRHAAGELAELLGPQVLPVDRASRLHRFREVARRAVARLDAPRRAELDAYVRGVNAGYASLGVRPFEYLVLGRTPAPWTAEDSVLVMLSMFLMLQQRDIAVESALGVAQGTLPPGLYRLLAAPGDEWDAPLEGPAFATPPLPGPEEFDVRRERNDSRQAAAARVALDPVLPGSNNWAVAGSHTAHGGALLANDMHLPLGVPATWYRTGLAWQDRRGADRHAWGATLPGGPGLIIGSNGRVAWGLTNSDGDWSDLIRLEVDPSDPDRYLTPEGSEPFVTLPEVIHVRGGADVARPVRWTRWGPVLDDTEYHRQHPHALHWLAHDPKAFGMAYLYLLEADTLEAALDTAARSAGPQCNFLAADASGSIGWTIFGRIPRRVGFDGRTPESWADGRRRWAGYLDPTEAPRILRPQAGRLWTANNRVVAGDKLAQIGYGGYDRGARAGQIRDGLVALEKSSEADMLRLQLDDRALFLARWQELLLGVLSGPWADADSHRGELRLLVASWGGRAARESVGYRMVLDFRERVSRAVLAPLTARCRRVDPGIPFGLGRSQEGAVWRILRERPVHLLDPAYHTWDELLQGAADATLAEALKAGPDLAARTWGEGNQAHLRHPLSRGMHGLSWATGLLADGLGLDMPPEQLDGGRSDMPRVQGPSFGASERMVVAPGREEFAYFHMPCGQSGHPLSPHYRDAHDAWARGAPSPFLPGAPIHLLVLEPLAQ